jgi:hypothetical protein
MEMSLGEMMAGRLSGVSSDSIGGLYHGGGVRGSAGLWNNRYDCVEEKLGQSDGLG